jgi:hypothetical protein
MQIFARTPQNATITVDIEGTDTVAVVKQKIAAKVGNIEAAAIDLVFNGTTLEDRQPIENYNVQKSCTVQVIDLSVQVFVRTLASTTSTISLVPTSTVAAAKRIISAKTGTAVDEFQLSCGATQLLDNRTLQDYNVQRNSTLVMAARLKGGRDL